MLVLTQLSQNVFWYLFAREKSPKIPVFEATSFQRGHDSMIFHDIVNQKVRLKDFPKILAYLPLKTQILYCDRA